MRDVLVAILFLCNVLILQADISVTKIGILKHGEGPVSSGREQGYDLNIECLWEDEVLAAYPAVGVSLNSSNYTNFAYAGLSWEGDLYEVIVWELFFGGAIHDGNLERKEPDKRAFGSRVLFREAISLGFYIRDNFSITLMYDHYSHSGMDESIPNQGNDNTGVRFIYYY